MGSISRGMIGSIHLWDIRASQAGFDNYNLEERDGESGTDCSDIKTGKAEDRMNTRNQWGWPFGFASTVGRMNRLLGLSPGVGRLCTNAALNGVIHMDFRHARNL
jgi:hypothetical protein